jgi:VanZ family protein
VPTAGRSIQRLLFGSRARRLWAAVLGLLVGFTLFKALSPPEQAIVTLGWDKADHLAAFAAIAGVGVIALHGVAGGRWWLGSGLLLLGALIEVAQLYVPGRSSDWQDLLADAGGIAIGLTLGAALTAHFERRKGRRGAGPATARCPGREETVAPPSAPRPGEEVRPPT